MRNYLGALLCSLFPFWTFAQQTEPMPADTSQAPVFQLREVLLVGDYLNDPVFSAQNQDHIKRIVQPRNVADLFRDFNGFSLIKRGNYAIDPSFRASQYEQLNVQFDGGTKVMHACPNRMDPITTHVIPEDITRIEVIKGPYSVRYGPVFAGVVNLVTGEPNRAEPGFHGSLSGGYETNGGSLVSQLRLQHVSDQTDLALSGAQRDFGNYKDGSGTEIPSSFRSLDYGLKAGWNPNDAQRLQLQWRQSFGRDVLHAGLPMDTEEDNSSILSLDYRLTRQGKAFRELNAKAYYAYVDHLMSNERRPSYADVSALSSLDAITAGGRLEFQWALSDRLVNFSGLDAQLLSRDGTRERLVKRMMGMPLPEPRAFTDKVWQDARLDDYGLFTEFRYRTGAKTVFTSGVRLDRVFSEARDPEADFAAAYPDLGPRTEWNISGNFSVKHYVSDRLLLEAAFGRGVRSANMIERFINHFTVGQDPYEYVGNPNLKAEVNHQFELGFKAWEPFGSGNAHRFEYGLTGYYSTYENYIVGVIDPTLTRKYMPMAEPREVKRYINLESAYKSGLEASAALALDGGFRFEAETAFVHTRNKDLAESLPLTPPLTTRLRVRYDRNRWWGQVGYTLTARQNRIAPSFGETSTPGYELLDIRMGWEVFRGLSLGAAVLNVFDTYYYDHLNFSFTNQEGFGPQRIPDPGRNFSVFASYTF